MLSSVFIPTYYGSATNVIDELEYLVLEKVSNESRGRSSVRNHGLTPSNVDDVEKGQAQLPLKPGPSTHFSNSSSRLLEIDMHKQRRSVSERPTRCRSSRSPMLDAFFPLGIPPRVLESLPKSSSFNEYFNSSEKSQPPKAKISVDKLNKLYKTYSKKFTMKIASQKRTTNVTAKSQRKTKNDRETLETITKIESTPYMFSRPEDLSLLATQKAKVLRAISSHKGRKVIDLDTLLKDEESLQGHKSYLDKYYSLRYLEKIAECEADKAIISNAKKLAADVGLLDDSKTKLWVKITLDEDGYNISIRVPLDFLFEESPVHDTLQTIYETADS